jgi:hypothetical protein
MQFYVAQIIGFAGMALTFAAFQNNEKKKILLFQIASSVFFAAHWLLLGKLTGVFINLWIIPRNMVFASERENKRKWVWTAVFIAGFLLIGVCTWESVFSLFPAVAMSLSTIVFGMKKPRNIRLFSLPVSALWMTYNIAFLSIAGITSETFVILSIAIAMFRYDIFKKKQN